MGFNVAIDGPAGSGKSTVARMAAKELHFVYVDTGAMYRAIGYACSERGIDADHEEAVSEAAEKMDVTIRYADGEQHILLDGKDVSSVIRTEKAGILASKVSRYPAVRSHLLGLQRKLASESDVLMDGRDIGTCVLPDAQVKIFLTAAPEIRAKRRCRDYELKGEPYVYEEVLQKIRERDAQDMNRSVAPLKQAEDAFLLDTSGLSLEEVLERVVSLVRRGMQKDNTVSPSVSRQS